MHTHKILTLATLALFTLATSAFSAGYLKIGDIKGESRAQSEEETNPDQNLSSDTTQQPAVLLLPAVQKIHDTATSSDKTADEEDSKKTRKGKVEAGWKVEEGQK